MDHNVCWSNQYQMINTLYINTIELQVILCIVVTPLVPGCVTHSIRISFQESMKHNVYNILLVS